MKLGFNKDKEEKIWKTWQLAYIIKGVELLVVNKSALCELRLLPRMWSSICVETNTNPLEYDEKKVQMSMDPEPCIKQWSEQCTKNLEPSGPRG